MIYDRQLPAVASSASTRSRSLLISYHYEFVHLPADT